MTLQLYSVAISQTQKLDLGAISIDSDTDTWFKGALTFIKEQQ